MQMPRPDSCVADVTDTTLEIESKDCLLGRQHTASFESTPRVMSIIPDTHTQWGGPGIVSSHPAGAHDARRALDELR